MSRKSSFVTLLMLPVILLLSVSTGHASGNDKADKKGVNWVDFNQAVALSKKEKKLLVIDFYTDWCHWCKVMDKETYGNKDVVNYSKNRVIFAKINAETTDKFKFREKEHSGRELSMMFGVSGFPTTAFMNGDGELITRISGFIPADRFQLILKYLAENWYQKMQFDEFEKQESQADES